MNDARDDFERPETTDDVAEREAAYYFQAAYRRQMEGKLEEAIQLYERSIALYPTAEAHTFLGWTYSFLGDLDRAIAECLRAIELDPEFGNPYNDIGAYLIERGDPLSATLWLKRAMKAKRYECYFYPHFNYGRVLEFQGRWMDAMREYSIALAYYPEYTAAKKAIRRLQCRLN
ncbi:MAG: tetratricopeptide repeat protein [Chloracidobacterium sp.]|nr:tetratricopeptide repeat protein [Chloracidobacterium sp.]MDW8217477.1 tetratricopeptide repeat protein [Acidobacteriota bacterium]